MSKTNIDPKITELLKDKNRKAITLNGKLVIL